MVVNPLYARMARATPAKNPPDLKVSVPCDPFVKLAALMNHSPAIAKTASPPTLMAAMTPWEAWMARLPAMLTMNATARSATPSAGIQKDVGSRLMIWRT